MVCVEIKIIDAIECEVPSALAKIIRPILSYTAVFYQQGPFGRKVRKEYEKSTLRKYGDDYYRFLAGHLDRVVSHCREIGLYVTVTGEVEKLEYKRIPIKEMFSHLPLRDIQVDLQEGLVTKALDRQRGVLKAPTGVGKTVLGLNVVAAFVAKGANAVWLCHTKDLMYQARDAAVKAGFTSVGCIGDGVKDTDKRVIFATRQSFIDVVRDIGHNFDVVVVDEVHHVSKSEGEYPTILNNLMAPVRLGLTATLPSEDKEAMLAIEGNIGPLIGEVTIAEGENKGIMAKIKIKFIKIPKSHQISALRHYQDVYNAAIVQRYARNRQIAEIAKDHTLQGDSVLILVNRIEHGENLLRACGDVGLKAQFVQGATESDMRSKMKTALNGKHIHCLIATTIFKEGVDIPELNVIINAAGGKSEIATLQAIGRGLRLTKEKKELLLYDLLDLSHNYLIDHLAHRLDLYSSNDWI